MSVDSGLVLKKSGGRRRWRALSNDETQQPQRLLDSTTDETPEAIDGSEVVSLASGKLATAQEAASSSKPENTTSSRGNNASAAATGGHSSPRGTAGALVASSSDARPHSALSQSTAAQREARLRYRQHRLRRLEQKRLTAVAGALVAREDRYGDRLFELAKLMPAKADVWEVELPEGSSLVAPASRWTSAATVAVPPINDIRRRQQHRIPKGGGNNNGSPPMDRRPLSAPKPTVSVQQQKIESLVIPTTLMDRKPLLVFVNVKSGGQVGAQLLKEFYKLLNPMQVVDIQSDSGPQRALTLFKGLADLDRLRVLVCGGDGSAGWVMEEIRRLYGPPTECHVPVGILPLGTGNDLSRVLGWGDSFDGDVQRCLMRVQSAQTRLLDQWSLKIRDQNTNTEILNTCFNNYMDIGVAARIALKFHQLREAHPELFQSRLGNKFLYGEMGVREWVTEKTLDLSKVRLWCDGLPVILPERKIQGLIVVNIPSFSGGVNLWSEEDVDHQTSTNIDFRHYNRETIQTSSPFHNHHHHPTAAAEFHHLTPPTHPTHFHLPPPQSTDISSRMQRRRLRASTPRMNGDNSSSTVWNASRRSVLPPTLSHSSRDQYTHLGPPSKSRPPLPKPRINLPQQHENHIDSSVAQSYSPRRDLVQDTPNDTTEQQPWKRQGRQGTFGRQECGGTRSVEPRHTTRSVNTVKVVEPSASTIPHDPVDTQLKAFPLTLPPAHARNRSTHKHKFHVTQMEPGLSPPFVTPLHSRNSSSLEGASQSSSDDSDFDDPSTFERPLSHRPRENSRSVADFRSPRQQASSSNGWIHTQTANGTSSAAGGETTSDEGPLPYESSSRHRNPRSQANVSSSRVTHTASGDPSALLGNTGSIGPSSFSGRQSPMIGGIFRRWQKQSMRDELIEVVAVRSLFHLGQIQVGLAEPLRVCQGRDIRIEIPVEVPFQIDGEPRMLQPQTTIDISYKGKSFVLSPVRSNDDALLLTVTEVLDAAVRDCVLTREVANCLVWELESRMR